MGLFGKLVDTAQSAATTVKTQAQSLAGPEATDNIKSLAGNAVDRAQAFTHGIGTQNETTSEPSNLDQTRAPKATWSFPLIDFSTPAISAAEQFPVESPIIGIERTFPLAGASLTISKELDKHVAYLTTFNKLAEKQFSYFEMQYLAQVADLQSFCTFMTTEYDLCLQPILEKATAYLFAEGVWDVTLEDLASIHRQNYCLFPPLWNTIQKLAQQATSTERAAYNLVGTATKGLMEYSMKRTANKGTAGALLASLGHSVGVFDTTLIDGVVSGLKSELGLTDEQQASVFEAIPQDELLKAIHVDFFSVSAALLKILSENSIPVWSLNDEERTRAETMLSNLKHADFTQSQAVQAICKVLLAIPFDKDLYSLLHLKLPDSEEVVAIEGYFMQAQPDVL